MENKKKRKLGWAMKKYYRWFRLYMKRVRITEQELGGEIHAC